MRGLCAFKRRGFPGRSAAAFAICLIVAATSASAQNSTDSAPPPPTQPTPDQGASIYNYQNVDKTCLSWSDGCRTCTVDMALAVRDCSNIGIACQPHEVTCLARQPDAEKK